MVGTKILVQKGSRASELLLEIFVLDADHCFCKITASARSRPRQYWPVNVVTWRCLCLILIIDFFSFFSFCFLYYFVHEEMDQFVVFVSFRIYHPVQNQRYTILSCKGLHGFESL
jgi:hypothetical protein